MFNAGIAYLQRLDNLHRGIQEALDENDLLKARIRLRLMMSELRKRASTEQIQGLEEQYNNTEGYEDRDLNNPTSANLFLTATLMLYDKINDVIREQRLELQDRAGDLDAIGGGLL